jgi:hypothetical protein
MYIPVVCRPAVATDFLAQDAQQKITEFGANKHATLDKTALAHHIG